MDYAITVKAITVILGLLESEVILVSEKSP
jgi:hypothetical protein